MIAGVILPLITYIILTALGTAIGMTALAPLSRPNPLQGYAFSSGAYLIVMTVIAVFVGSWFAGRSPPDSDRGMVFLRGRSWFSC